MAARIDLTLDCTHAPLVAAFWKLALGYEDEPPPPPFATRAEWLAEHGDPGDEPDHGAWLRDPAGVGPRLSILKVPEPKVTKNRLHIDVRLDAPADPAQRWAAVLAKVDQLTEVGGSVLDVFDGHHVVMADPEGNEFCVC